MSQKHRQLISNERRIIDPLEELPDYVRQDIERDLIFSLVDHVVERANGKAFNLLNVQTFSRKVPATLNHPEYGFYPKHYIYTATCIFEC